MNILTGNPGTGKHTIAGIIAKKLSLNIIDISKIAQEKKLVEKNGGVLDVDVNKLKKIIDKTPSNNTLLVGHLAPYVVSSKNVNIAIVLRNNPYTLTEVYRKRRYSKKKSIENIGSEILGVTYFDTLHAFGKKKTIQIDTSKRNIRDNVNMVESIIKGRKIKEDNTDWLNLILKNGDMKKFFPY